MPVRTDALSLTERIRRAAKHSGLTVPMILERCPRSHQARFGNLMCGAEANEKDWMMMLWLSDLLQVDPRWLITGEIFEGIRQQLDAARKAFLRSGASARTITALMPHLELLPWPALAAGTCRYCACTQENGCGDCYWVDASATICSACLIVEKEQQ